MIFYKSQHDPQLLVKVTPDKGDLKQINALAIEPMSAEEVYCGSMALCNNQYDRAYERFPESYLKRFADTVVGKSVLSGHDYRSLPVGRFYDAELHQSKGDRLDLVTRYYMMADDALVPKIKAGVVKGVSVGFQPDKRICDLDGKDYDGWWNDPEDEEPCFHIAGRAYDGTRSTVTYGGDETLVSADEGSFVWLGCQYGAETVARGVNLSPEAKGAYLTARESGRERVWALSAAQLWQPPSVNQEMSGSNSGRLVPTAGSGGRPSRPPAKEKAMGEKDEKGAGGGEKPGVTEAEFLRLKSEAEAGQRYRERMLDRIKTRYAASNLEETGAAIAEGLKSASIESVEKAEADAEKLFERHHAPAGAGVPESAGDSRANEEKVFNPLRHRPEEYF